MPESISSLPPATAPIHHASDDDGAPDTHEIAFNELWENKKEGISFSDVLDIVNPLQHIPVVSTIYRMITGDEISMGARMAGSVLFGGPLGLIGAGVVSAVEDATGDKIEGHIAGIFNDSPGNSEQLAAVPNSSFEEEDDTNSPGMVEPPTENTAAGQLSATSTNSAAVTAASLTMPISARKALGAQMFGNAQIPSVAQAGSTQLSQIDERKILQFLSDRKDATAEVATKTASEKQRLSDAILKAQRAQTGLLLANLGTAASNTLAPTEDKEHKAPQKTQAAPATPFFKPHPYMLPRGAPPALVAKAMERALERYNTLNIQKGAPAPTPNNANR